MSIWAAGHWTRSTPQDTSNSEHPVALGPNHAASKGSVRAPGSVTSVAPLGAVCDTGQEGSPRATQMPVPTEDAGSPEAVTQEGDHCQLLNMDNVSRDATPGLENGEADVRVNVSRQTTATHSVPSV